MGGWVGGWVGGGVGGVGVVGWWLGGTLKMLSGAGRHEASQQHSICELRAAGQSEAGSSHKKQQSRAPAPSLETTMGPLRSSASFSASSPPSTSTQWPAAGGQLGQASSEDWWRSNAG